MLHLYIKGRFPEDRQWVYIMNYLYFNNFIEFTKYAQRVEGHMVLQFRIEDHRVLQFRIEDHRVFQFRIEDHRELQLRIEDHRCCNSE